MVVKKYSNRRMYDTKTSSYVRLEELAERIRGGENLRIVDADSGQDLTHAALVQLLMESRGVARLLPEPVLLRLLRLDDAALSEFTGSWLGWALETYLRERQPVSPPAIPYDRPRAAAPQKPVPGTPQADDWADDGSSVASGVRAKEGTASKGDVAALRRELDELKELIRGTKGKRRSG